MAATLLAILAVVIALAIIAGVVWWTLRPAHRAVHEASPPPLVFLPSGGSGSGGSLPRLRPLRDIEPAYAHAGAPLNGTTPSAVGAADGHVFADPAGAAPAAAVARRRRDSPLGVRTAPVEAAPENSVLTGTLRMLPGRLEPLAGLASTSEIRFVQLDSAPQQRVTIGRQEGPPYEHVRLASQTVSRLHAAMTFALGRWTIANLSETNPLRVNGDVLPAGAPPRALADGDVLELGEVLLRFRA